MICTTLFLSYLLSDFDNEAMDVVAQQMHLAMLIQFSSKLLQRCLTELNSSFSPTNSSSIEACFTAKFGADHIVYFSPFLLMSYCSRCMIAGPLNFTASYLGWILRFWLNSSATSIVQQRCNGKSRCKVFAKDAVFGDPCPGISKFLEIEFNCVKPNATGWNLNLII